MFPLLILINLIPVGSQSICILEDLRGIDAVIRSDSSEPFPYTQVIDIMVESTTLHADTGYNSSDIEQNRQVLMILRRQCKTLPWNSKKAMCLSYVSKDGVRRGRHGQEKS